MSTAIRSKGSLAVTALALLAGAIALLLVAGPGPQAAKASSHREAPLIATDPTADNTDLYAFVSPDRPDTVTIVANYIPFEEPAGGPNFFNFDPSALYTIHIDNNGDGRDDVAYKFRFSTETRNPDTFLYNTGPIGSLERPELERPAVLHAHPRGRSPRDGARLTPAVAAEQHRPAVDAELRQPRDCCREHALRRGEGLRRPA